MLKNWIRRRRNNPQESNAAASVEEIRRKLAGYQSNGQKADFTGPQLHYATPLFPEEHGQTEGG